MKVCGFTFIKNGVKYGYPFQEAIRSILPLCDKLIVAVGDCEDETREIVEKLAPSKIEIIDTIWDKTLVKGGAVLAAETNKAIEAINENYDWCFYIQGDEVVHEKDYDTIRQAMKSNLNRSEVDGLLFKYLHFFGTFDYIGDSRKWYRREIRIVRNNGQVQSHGDAQGFRLRNGKKLSVKLIDANIYHYGWVRPPKVMLSKQNNFASLYSDPQDKSSEEFDYGGKFDSLERFTGSHPAVMQERINALNWHPELDVNRKNLSLRRRLLYAIEKTTGKRLFEYRNYKLLK